MGSSNAYSQNQKFTTSGYVREKGSKESLIGVNVYLPDKKIGTATNNFGFYSLTIPAGDSITLIFSYVGFNQHVKKFLLKENLELNIELEQDLVLPVTTNAMIFPWSVFIKLRIG